MSMTKFILLMLVCSGIPGNDCKPIPTPIEEFDTYHECARHGYDSAADLMNNFSDSFVDEYRAYIIFSCKENQII